MSLLALSGVVVLGIIDVCHAADATELSSTGCIDKSGFEKCLSDAADESAICIKAASGELDSTDNCGHVYRVNQMGCYMLSCWNRIYSCEYAALAAEYTAGRNLVTPEPIPFRPAPTNAPGAYSCNIGEASVSSSQLYLGSIRVGCISLDIPDLFV